MVLVVVVVVNVRPPPPPAPASSSKGNRHQSQGIIIHQSSIPLSMEILKQTEEESIKLTGLQPTSSQASR